MASHEEQKPLMEEDLELYKGEKEPESKTGELDAKVPVVHGAPVGDEIALGEPVPRQRHAWSTGLFSCFGNNDEFCGNDLEVCVLGLFAPCVLYGSNMERLFPGRSTFASHCMAYSSLYFMGHFLFNGNLLAPCFSFPSRGAIRRTYNLQGDGESLANSAGCCACVIEDEDRRERCNEFFDFAAHICCHPCSLCQEGREIRRRTVHPAHRPRYYTPLAPPSEQVMSPQEDHLRSN